MIEFIQMDLERPPGAKFCFIPFPGAIPIFAEVNYEQGI